MLNAAEFPAMEQPPATAFQSKINLSDGPHGDLNNHIQYLTSTAVCWSVFHERGTQYWFPGYDPKTS